MYINPEKKVPGTAISGQSGAGAEVVVRGAPRVPEFASERLRTRKSLIVRLARMFSKDHYVKFSRKSLIQQAP